MVIDTAGAPRGAPEYHPSSDASVRLASRRDGFRRPLPMSTLHRMLGQADLEVAETARSRSLSDRCARSTYTEAAGAGGRRPYGVAGVPSLVCVHGRRRSSSRVARQSWPSSRRPRLPRLHPAVDDLAAADRHRRHHLARRRRRGGVPRCRVCAHSEAAADQLRIRTTTFRAHGGWARGEGQCGLALVHVEPTIAVMSCCASARARRALSAVGSGGRPRMPAFAAARKPCALDSRRAPSFAFQVHIWLAPVRNLRKMRCARRRRRTPMATASDGAAPTTQDQASYVA